MVEAAAAVAIIVEVDPELGSEIKEEISKVSHEVGNFVAEEAPQIAEAASNIIEEAPAVMEGEELPIQSTANEYTDLLYRGGSRTMSNMTPKMTDVVNLPGGEEPGLSTYNSIDNLLKGNPNIKPGDTVQVIDTSKLEGTGLRTIFDSPAEGHVTISVDSGNIQDLIDWASTRPNVVNQSDLTLAHPYTISVLNALGNPIYIPK